MTALLRIAGFAAILAVAFAAAAVAGSEINPSVDESASEHAEEDEQTSGQDGHAAGEGAGHADDADALPPGLAVAQDELRLVPDRTSLPRGESATYRFRILDADGEIVRDFDVEHERRMHLIVVRRDFTGFQHLHPRMQADGTWETQVDLADAGVYRVFADFAGAGTSATLASDLFVAGAFEPQPLPEPAEVAPAGEGYEVRLDSAKPQPGDQTPVEFTVMRDGERVDRVEPYLGADGHLVALREHDQAFLHTHPEGKAGGPGPIRFEVSYPTAGRYRLYLQFRHGGKVRTVAFTQEVGDADAGAAPQDDSRSGAAHGEPGHGH